MRSYLKATGLVAGLTFGTNLLGFVREMLFAREFGASSEADVYVTAFSIAALCFLVFSGGALQGAFMPRYQNRLVRGDPLGARALFKAILLPLMLLLCAAHICIDPRCGTMGGFGCPGVWA